MGKVRLVSNPYGKKRLDLSKAIGSKPVENGVKNQGTNTLISTKHHDSKKMGMVAKRNILPGERLWTETPFLTFSTKWSLQEQYESVTSQISSLTRGHAKELSLYRSFEVPFTEKIGLPSPSNRDVDIASSYSFEFGDKCRGLFLYVETTRYSCCPNVEVSVVDSGIATVHAKCFIAKGTEITRNWNGSLNLSFRQRQELFKAKFQTSSCSCFVCERCKQDTAFQEKDNFIRKRIELENERFNSLLHTDFSAAEEHGITLISLLEEGSCNVAHFCYTDLALLRVTHMKLSAAYIRYKHTIHTIILQH